MTPHGLGGLRVWAALLMASCAVPVAAQRVHVSRSPDARDARITSIRFIYGNNNETRMRFVPATPQFVTFDAVGADGFRDVFIGDLNGNYLTALTHERAGLPQRHNGNGRANPAGTFVVFNSEADEHYQDEVTTSSDPGIGQYANLWAIHVESGTVSQLTDVPIKLAVDDGIPVYANCNPQWSADGSTLYWAEMYSNVGFSGSWRIRSATFAIDGETASLTDDVAIYTAPVSTLLSPMGVIDANTILTAGTLNLQHTYRMDLYVVDHVTDTWRNLTRTMSEPKQAWDEDACLSPTSDWLVYMSTKDMALPPIDESVGGLGGVSPRTRDYYMVKTDGTGTQRLTYFQDPTAPEYRGFRTGALDCTFSPDGLSMAINTLNDLGTDPESFGTVFLQPGIIRFREALTN